MLACCFSRRRKNLPAAPVSLCLITRRQKLRRPTFCPRAGYAIYTEGRFLPCGRTEEKRQGLQDAQAPQGVEKRSLIHCCIELPIGVQIGGMSIWLILIGVAVMVIFLIPAVRNSTANRKKLAEQKAREQAQQEAPESRVPPDEIPPKSTVRSSEPGSRGLTSCSTGPVAEGR